MANAENRNKRWRVPFKDPYNKDKLIEYRPGRYYDPATEQRVCDPSKILQHATSPHPKPPISPGAKRDIEFANFVADQNPTGLGLIQELTSEGFLFGAGARGKKPEEDEVRKLADLLFEHTQSGQPPQSTRVTKKSGPFGLGAETIEITFQNIPNRQVLEGRIQTEVTSLKERIFGRRRKRG